MHLKRKLFFTTSAAVLLLLGQASAATPADEKDKVLRRLDAAAMQLPLHLRRVRVRLCHHRSDS